MDVEHDGIRTPVIQSSRKLEPSKVQRDYISYLYTCIKLIDKLLQQ